jgi:hypothetical protein
MRVVTAGPITPGTTAHDWEPLVRVDSLNEDLRVVRGGVNTASPGTILQGAGFTITRLGTGEVKVTFTTAFSGVPTVTPTARTFTHKANAGEPLAGSVLIGVNASGAAVDGVVDFIAAGPR